MTSLSQNKTKPKKPQQNQTNKQKTKKTRENSHKFIKQRPNVPIFSHISAVVVNLRQ